MNLTKLLRSLVPLVMALPLASCSPPPPPPPPPPPTSGTGTSSTSKTTYSVTVNPVGPATWSYAITASAPFVSVTVHSKDDIRNCVLTSNGGTPPQGAVASNPAPTDQTLTAAGNPSAGVSPGWTGLTLHVKCDMSNGAINLLFTEPGTAPQAQAVVGSLAGPVK